MDFDLVTWLYAEGDFLLFLCRVIVLVFSLQFVTGFAWIIRGGVKSCS